MISLGPYIVQTQDPIIIKFHFDHKVVPPHQSQTENFSHEWKDPRSSPSQSTPTPASNTTAAAAVDDLDHDNAEKHSLTPTPPSQPDISAPTTVEAACEAASTASTAFFNMKTPKDQVSSFLDTFSNFNNMVSELAEVNVTHTL